MDRSRSEFLADALRQPEPQVRRAPRRVRTYRLRVDLKATKPPVWRRLEVAGDLTLDAFHDVLQTAMGWLDGHLHRFYQGRDGRAPYFLTEFDLEEGEDGIAEEDVRLDQVLTAVGGVMTYDYDFGDGWEHRIKVEAITDEPPEVPARCLTGRLACPPEDCGGVWAYAEIAEWVRSGYAVESAPTHHVPEELLDWLPPGWHPDEFDVAQVNRALGHR